MLISGTTYIFSILISFIVLCAVADCRTCKEWHKAQVAVKNWHGDLNVITQPSNSDIDLQLLFSEYSDPRVNDTINVNNNLLDIQLLADYDQFGNPVLNSIVLNGVKICDQIGGSALEFKSQGGFQPELLPPANPTTSLPFTDVVYDTYTIPDECGIVIPEITPYIHHGNQATVSEFPWHAIIFNVPQYKYRCGGSLISHNLIVIAAHCVTRSQTPYPLSRSSIIAVLGKDQLRTSSIVEQLAYIAEIFVHQEFDPSNFNNDIAVLKLQTRIVYTNFVRPICIWPHRNDRIDSIVNKFGSIPGFGYNEHWDLPDQLASVKMPVVSFEKCLSSHRDFYARVISEKNFCAGSRNGSSVCNGDSGGGMVFKIKSLYYLRGIVSIGPSDTIDRTRCNTQYYIVFTDVAKYVDWLKQF